tara:strand:- start:125 stop:439 length:315 start_codon:yes stop_codon:yes gene_type:complete
MNNKINKPLIIIIFTLTTTHSIINRLKVQSHINTEISQSFIDGGIAGLLALGTFMFSLLLGAFILVFFIKLLWNNLVPNITNWKKIDYWEAMGLTTIIILLTYI